LKKRILSIDEQLLAENQVIDKLISFFEMNLDFSKVIYEVWTAKDVLGHITSWHLSFERNLSSAVNNEKAVPFSGSLADVNEKEVENMKMYSVNDLIEKIRKSQDYINKNIKNHNVNEIAYKKGSRNYSPIEHIEVVQRHINSHLKDLENKYKEEKSN